MECSLWLIIDQFVLYGNVAIGKDGQNDMTKVLLTIKSGAVLFTYFGWYQLF